MHLPNFLYDADIPALEHHRRTLDWCREMRERHPIVYDEDHRMWMVFRYDDGLRVRRDHATFSSENMIPAEHNFKSITNLDPPRHQQLRSLVTQAFSARTVNAMAPQVEAIVERLLDGVAARGEMDWVAELANPLPLQVIAQMLGLEPRDWPLYSRWTESLVSRTEAMGEGVSGFMDRFASAIEERQAEPRDDVLGLLISAEVDGERLGYGDLIGFCFTLFVAGYITTTNMLGNCL